MGNVEEANGRPAQAPEGARGGSPHAAISLERAPAIAAFFGEDAAPLQVVSANSVIIVLAGLPGELRRRYGEAEAEKICSGNAVRVLRGA